MEVTALYFRLLMDVLLLLDVQVQNCYAKKADAAFPHIAPNKLQFFEYESISVDCGELDYSSEWRVMRKLKEVPTNTTQWETSTGTITIKPAFTSDSGEYWCENKEGDRSSSVNITITASEVILQSPTVPVMEGESVSLSCRNQMAISNLPADFYKDGLLSSTGYEGDFNINHVSKSDEGLYKCSISGVGESPESWLAVRGGSVRLETPVLPVMEEDAVTFHCKNSIASSNILASFIKDGFLIKNISTGNMTIHCASGSDEGLYKCNTSRAGESPESWLIVRALHRDTHPPLDCSCHIYLILRTVFTILMVALLLLLVGLLHSGKLRVTQKQLIPSNCKCEGNCQTEQTKSKRQRIPSKEFND